MKFGVLIIALAANLLTLVRGGIVTNFTVEYEYVASDEVVLFQNAIEDIGYISDMQVAPIEFHSSDVPSKPVNVTTRAVSMNMVEVTWSKVNFTEGNYTVIGYAIYYSRYQSNGVPTWERASVLANVTQYNVSYLLPFTLYTFRVLAFHAGGNGISSQFVDETTLEGVPSEAPSNFKCIGQSATKISMTWDLLDGSKWNGFAKEYLIEYAVYRTNKSSTVSFPSVSRTGVLSSLKPSTRYEIYIRAVTRAGQGKRAWCELSTEEGTPSVGPEVYYYKVDDDRPTEATIKWNAIPSDQVNGKLQGYMLYYGESKIGKEEFEYPPMKKIELDKYTSQYTLKNLKIYSETKIVIKGFTGVGEGVESKPVYLETCICPVGIYATWFENEPYVSLEDNGKVSGIFPEFLTSMIKTLCGTCAIGQQPKLYWDRTKTGHSPVRKNQKELKSMVDNSAHIHVAMFGRSEIRTFQSDFRYVSIINSPGIAFIVRDPLAELDKTSAIMRSLASCWPAVIIIFLFSLVAGIFIWVADCKVNAEEFPGESFIKGIYHGAYWAFVSMTTVGYGDKTPKSFQAQVIAIAWMLMGPIINGIVVGAITTSLTTINLESDPKIYGSKVAARPDTFQFNLGVRRNAKMVPTNYTHNEEMINDLANRKVDGLLMDSLTAASMYEIIGKKKLKISKLIPEQSGWGVILSGDLLRLENEIRSYVNQKEEDIKKMVANKTDGKLYIQSKPPSSLDTGIVDANSKAFKDFVLYGLITFGILCVLGLTWEHIILRIRKKKIVPYSQEHRHLLENELASIVTDFCEGLSEMILTKSNDHESELKRLFWKKGYSFGVDGWLREKTNDENMLKNKIRYHEIMSKDLGLYKKKYSPNWTTKIRGKNLIKVAPISDSST